jgi:hypothetical protein
MAPSFRIRGERQAHLKRIPSRFGLDSHLTAMIWHEALNGVEPKSRGPANSLVAKKVHRVVILAGTALEAPFAPEEFKDIHREDRGDHCKESGSIAGCSFFTDTRRCSARCRCPRSSEEEPGNGEKADRVRTGSRQGTWKGDRHLSKEAVAESSLTDVPGDLLLDSDPREQILARMDAAFATALSPFENQRRAETAGLDSYEEIILADPILFGILLALASSCHTACWVVPQKPALDRAGAPLLRLDCSSTSFEESRNAEI